MDELEDDFVNREIPEDRFAFVNAGLIHDHGTRRSVLANDLRSIFA
jgi:hypothetical protein